MDDDVLENKYSSSFEEEYTAHNHKQLHSHNPDDIIVSEEVINSGKDRYDLDDEMPISLIQSKPSTSLR